MRFNTKLSQSRQVIENCFQLLKIHFRVLQYLEVDIEHAPGIIQAWCRLHNYTLRSVTDGILFNVDDFDELIIPVCTAVEKRNFIAANL